VSRRAAVAAALVFWPALFAFAAAYPGYSHSTRAISELGAFGAPHALAWNLIGFVVPGLLLAYCGAGVALAIDGRRRSLFWLLVISGLAFAGAGVCPAEMRHGVPIMQSGWTAAHLVMISASGVPWVIGALVLIGSARRSSRWRHLTAATVGLALLAVAGLGTNILSGSIPALAHVPGLAQRIAFGAYFAWFLVAESVFLTTGSTHIGE